MNRPVRLAFLAAAAGALILGTAAPGSAAGAKLTSYGASLAFTGNVSATTTHAGSGTELQDYLSDQYYDRVAVNPGKSERVTLTVSGDTAPVVCASGTFFQGGISVYGDQTAWANVKPATTVGARVEIGCLYPDGKQHRFHWGNRKGAHGEYLLPSTNCVQLTRVDGSTYRLTADAVTCMAQDEIVNTRGQQVGTPVDRSMPFTATLTVAGTPAYS